jgi:hypothetical protein
VVEHECGSEGRAHAEWHKYRREPEVKTAVSRSARACPGTRTQRRPAVRGALQGEKRARMPPANAATNETSTMADSRHDLARARAFSIIALNVSVG